MQPSREYVPIGRQRRRGDRRQAGHKHIVGNTALCRRRTVGDFIENGRNALLQLNGDANAQAAAGATAAARSQSARCAAVAAIVEHQISAAAAAAAADCRRIETEAAVTQVQVVQIEELIAAAAAAVYHIARQRRGRRGGQQRQQHRRHQHGDRQRRHVPLPKHALPAWTWRLLRPSRCEWRW